MKVFALKFRHLTGFPSSNGIGLSLIMISLQGGPEGLWVLSFGKSGDGLKDDPEQGRMFESHE